MNELTSNDPEPPVGTVVVTVDDGVWERWTDDGQKCWAELGCRDNDVESWTRVAGNYGPVRVLVSAEPARNYTSDVERPTDD